MKEISPKELQKLNDKSIKAEKKIFRRRLREIAAGGRVEADFDKGHFCHEDEIITWLRSLGFKVTAGAYKYHITWPETEAPDKKKEWHMMVQRGDRRQCHPEAVCLKSGNPAWYLYHWKHDPIQWDYICSCCDEHSE